MAKKRTRGHPRTVWSETKIWTLDCFLDLKKERENFQETKEGEERHFQRNIVRLNEEIERERMFR